MSALAFAMLLAGCSIFPATTVKPTETGISSSSLFSLQDCPTTPIYVDPNNGARFHRSDDGRIWVPARAWTAGWIKDKYFVGKPRGSSLEILGRRMDGEGVLHAYSPRDPNKFAFAWLPFTSEGCWEVEARTDGSSLRFVTLVAESPLPTPTLSGEQQRLATAILLRDQRFLGSIRGAEYYITNIAPLHETCTGVEGASHACVLVPDGEARINGALVRIDLPDALLRPFYLSYGLDSSGVRQWDVNPPESLFYYEFTGVTRLYAFIDLEAGEVSYLEPADGEYALLASESWEGYRVVPSECATYLTCPWLSPLAY
ncbi:MAG: hypothetical protein HY532_04510 [Chloroflexi bacterium]|nr:hypothetical protein [Chloroflexota bacterium]